MPFREKSAWVMMIVLSVIAIGYFSQIIQWSMQTGEIVAPNTAGVVRFTLAIVVWTVIAHIVLSMMWPKEAHQNLDERERVVHDRAGHWSGLILGIGVVSSLGHYMFYLNGSLLFYMVFASLILSQVGEYMFRIINYRRSL